MRLDKTLNQIKKVIKAGGLALLLSFLHFISYSQDHYLSLDGVTTTCLPGNPCYQQICPESESRSIYFIMAQYCAREPYSVSLATDAGTVTEEKGADGKQTGRFFIKWKPAYFQTHTSAPLTVYAYFHSNPSPAPQCSRGASSYNVVVSPYPLPIVTNGNIAGPATVTRGEGFSYTLQGATQNVFSYSWTFDGTPIGGTNGPYIDFSQIQPGNHSLKCVPGNHCFATNPSYEYTLPITVNLSCNPQGTVSIEGGAPLLVGETRRVFLSNVINIKDYNWQLSDGLQNLGNNPNGGINVMFAGGGNYEIKALPVFPSCTAISRSVKVVYPCTSDTKFSSEIVTLPPPPSNEIVIESGCSQTYISTRSAILKPGLRVNDGGELIIHVDETPPSNPASDENRNWEISKAYDGDGNVIGESKQFFDKLGRPTQSQIKSIASRHVLAAQTIYDEYGEPVLSTLPAPIFNQEFKYKENFIINPSGEQYSYRDFDLSTQAGTPGEVNNPKPVGQGDIGSLGWYYSNKNNLEPYADITQYPYSREWAERGPDPKLSKSSGPGDQHKMGSGKETETASARISSDPVLRHYHAIRAYFVTGSGITENTEEGYKITVRDANDKEAISYINSNGDAIISAVSNGTGYDYAYNIFDDMGNLVAEIAPRGVNMASTNRPAEFVTTYTYDQLGGLLSSTSTDEGTSEFVYSDDGKIRFSQNQLQRTATPPRFSYLNYDDSDRPIESGEYVMSGPDCFIFQNHLASPISDKSILKLVNKRGEEGALDAGRCQYMNKTYYDLPSNSYPTNNEHLPQNFLYGGISKTENDQTTTWYSYDQFGRLEWTQQDIAGLGLKTIQYTYDLNGNVLRVGYQQGKPDAFYHHYEYDEELRLKAAYTSKDGSTKNLQARYYYYIHGPVKRVELGDKLQGIDYVYNVQGLLKSINHPIAANDPGKDGTNGFSEDAFGLELDYFSGDYLKTETAMASVDPGADYAPQYGGNIRAMSWKTKKPASVLSLPGIEAATTYAFKYDPKYQLQEATWGTPNFVTGQFTAQNIFKEYDLKYDAHGNITDLKRNGDVENAPSIHNFKYNYLPSSNKLESIPGYASYKYDAIGQLIEETKGGITAYLSYDPSGNVTGLYADQSRTQPKVTFSYDDGGQRVKKVNYGVTPNITTYYVRDAAGNIMATYDNNNTPLIVKELPIYGAGRIGQYNALNNTTVYELTDHLGNVRALVSSVKQSDVSVDVADYSDYYPFGSIARHTNSAHYKFGYQGQYAEKDEETGWNSFELRMYDGAIGRWLSPDPMREYYSPYVGMGNDPVNNVDPSGGCTECPDKIFTVYGMRYLGMPEKVSNAIIRRISYTIYNMASYNAENGFSNGRIPIGNNGSGTRTYQTDLERIQARLPKYESGATLTARELPMFYGWGESSNLLKSIPYGILDGVYMTAQLPFTRYLFHLDGSNATQREREVAGVLALSSFVGIIGKAGQTAKGLSPITGYTKHGLSQAIGRNGGRGVSLSAMKDAVRNPKNIIQQANGNIKYIGKNASVILNPKGKVVTTFGKARGAQIYQQGRAIGGGAAQRRALKETGAMYNPNMIR